LAKEQAEAWVRGQVAQQNQGVQSVLDELRARNADDSEPEDSPQA
jgi:hypothetical protein